MLNSLESKVLARVDETMEEMIDFLRALVRIPTVNPPGADYTDCAELIGTVDEESGGMAGVAYLAGRGYLTRDSIDYVIITEPLDYDRICLGHRGLFWFEVAMQGRIAHGSMPFLGASAIDRMARLIERVERELKPRLAARKTKMPVEPPAARSATINVNAISGGQSLDQAPK